MSGRRAKALRRGAMAAVNRARFVAEYWHEVVGPAHMAVFASVV